MHARPDHLQLPDQVLMERRTVEILVAGCEENGKKGMVMKVAALVLVEFVESFDEI